MPAVEDTDVGKLRVVTRDNGAGLSRDLLIVADALRDEHEVSATRVGPHHLFNQLQHRWEQATHRFRDRFDVQVSLERIYSRLLGSAHRNLLMPNPEWFAPEWIDLLPRFDQVLCKTRHAQALFSALGCDTTYIGFSSVDRLMSEVPRKHAFFHLAGRSSAKGTAVVLEAWLRHPEWPQLTVVQSARKAPTNRIAGNVRLLTGYLDDRDLQRLQNAHRFHVCPSEAERFGHSIGEALSVGAVVLTTDAAPMNELVDADCGLILESTPGAPMGLVRRHQVSVAAIEAGVAQALMLDDLELARRGHAARARFLSRRAQFHLQLRAALHVPRDPVPDTLKHPLEASAPVAVP